MKKIYSFALASIISTAAFCQKQAAMTEHKAMPRQVLSQDGNPHATVPLTANERGACVWSEDFDNGFAGNNGVGPITALDNGDTPIWMVANAMSPAGQFSSNIAALASPTASNGWVIFDCDLYNADLSNVIAANGTITTPALDFSSLETVIVDYYHYFRYCCFPGSPLTVEVTNDGVNWVVFPAHGFFFESANQISANAMHASLDISCVAAGESNVRIRWGFNTAEAAGYGHYFWGIDDICIYANPIENNLRIRQVTNGDIFNIWEYRDTPMEQKVSATDGGVLVGVLHQNLGSVSQTNTTIKVEVLDDQMAQLAMVETVPFTMLSIVNDPVCPSPVLDTLWIQTNWEPTATGLYYIKATITCADFIDFDTTDNVYLHDIEFTDYEYGHDCLDSLDIQVGPANGTVTGTFKPCGFGSFFTFPNTGSTAYGLTTLFGSASDQNTYMEYLLTEIAPGGTLNTNGSDVAAGETELILEWIEADYPQYFPYEDPYIIDNANTYFCSVRNPNDGGTDQLSIQAWDNSDSDNSTASWEETGAGDFVWFSSQIFTPAVRLILSELVNVEELQVKYGLSNFLVSPNPASNNVKVNFNIDKARFIAYEVRSIDGKLIEWANVGMFPSGKNTLPLDVSNYAAGNYQVSIVIDGEQIFSTQMSVVK